VLHPPHGFTDEDLVATLARHWHVRAESVTYRPVGFGSHHWEVAAETRWFATVDEPPDFACLRGAFSSAVGIPFAIAPVPTRDGEPLARSGRFAVTLYPFVEGESFEYGPFRDTEHHRAALDMVVEVHRTPPRHAFADDFAMPDLPAIGDEGPYSRRAAELLTQHAPAVERLRARHAELVARIDPARAVLTHGEPHAGNTMLTSEGWRLIDWETARVAPPERDLWHIATPEILAAYEEVTGVRPLPEMLELYRVQWDLSDLLELARRFSIPHTGTPNDDKSWEMLHHLVRSWG
jgi:spectinomycin phosphotransferase/16S rRNA (guanine(1405)-N(7))-methyltransferase